METSNLSQLTRKAEILYKANIPLLILSRPGEGKTSFLRAFAKDRGIQLRTFSGAYSSPEDIGGLPDPELRNDKHSGRVRWMLPDWLPLEGDASPESGILFFDDIGASTRGVQASLLEVLCSRSIRGQNLKPNWWIVSASNRVEDASEADPISFAYANRGAVTTYETTMADVAHLATMLGWPSPLSEFYAWAAAMKQDLTRPNMTQVEAGDYAQPTNRARGNLAAAIHAGATSDDYAMIVGSNEACKIIEYVTIAAEAPTLRDILANPSKVSIPDKLGVQYAVAVGIASYAVADLAGTVNIEPFVKRLSRPIQSYYRAIVRDRKPEALNLPAWSEWAKSVSVAPTQV